MRNDSIMEIKYSPIITWDCERLNGVDRVVSAKVVSIEPTAYLVGGARIRAGAMLVDVDLEFDDAGCVTFDLPDHVVEDVRSAIGKEVLRHRLHGEVERRIADIFGAA
jgi:hypothetical protein